MLRLVKVDIYICFADVKLSEEVKATSAIE